MDKTLCIIVPYRDRKDHLERFIPYIKTFIQMQGIKFHIIIVEQIAGKSFNRAKLLNIGFQFTEGSYDYYCCHDVDMLPFDDVDYSYCSNPCHLASMAQQFGFTMPYPGYFGGVTMFTTEDFKKINGYSNGYWGWGQEDDDCRERVLSNDLIISRRDGRFTSLAHINNSTSPEFQLNHKRFCEMFVDGKFIIDKNDGLSGLKYSLIDSKISPLVSHIKVDI